MYLSKFVKKFDFPDGFSAPTELKYENLVARPLKRSDLKDDMEGVNSSLDTIRNTRGGSWPSEAVSEDFDLLDLAWHEREFRNGGSYAYVVYDTDGVYVGCVYLYPMGARAALTEESLQYDVDASWWVTKRAYEKGEYAKLYAGLQQWLTKDFPFQKPYFSNKEIPS